MEFLVRDKVKKKIKKLKAKVNNSQNAKELLSGSSWSIIGSFISKGALFVSWIIVARVLGKETYGQFGILRSTILMFVSFSGLSLGLTVSKHISQFIEREQERIPRLIGMVYVVGVFLGIVFTVLLWSFSYEISENYLQTKELGEELKISSVVLFFSTLNGVNIGVLQGFMQFKKIAMINLKQSAFSVPFFILGALYGGLYGSILAFMFSYIVVAFFSSQEVWIYLKSKRMTFSMKDFFVEREILFFYSLPAVMSGLMVTPVKWYTESMLIKSSGFPQMGIFVAAMTFNTIIVMMINTVSAPFITVMSKNKHKNSINLERFNVMAPWGLGVLICLPLMFFPTVGTIVFGESFKGEVFNEVFLMVVFITILMMFKQGLAHIIAVYNLQWWSLLSNAIWGGALISFFYFSEVKDALNLSRAYIFSYVVNIIFLLPIYYKRKIIPKKTIELLESFIIWGILIGVMMLFKYTINVYVKGVLFIITLFVVLFLFFKIYKKSESN